MTVSAVRSSRSRRSRPGGVGTLLGAAGPALQLLLSGAGLPGPAVSLVGLLLLVTVPLSLLGAVARAARASGHRSDLVGWSVGITVGAVLLALL